MKKTLLLLLSISLSLATYSQISVYEFQDDKVYCTFELDSKLTLDSGPVRGTYRAYQYYNILYFEMTFWATASLSEGGAETVIKVVPDFYYYANLAKLTGEREYMNSEGLNLTFRQEANSISCISTEERKSDILSQSTFSQKLYINIASFPASFTKANTINWKKFPKDLRKNLQDKDKIYSRKY